MAGIKETKDVLACIISLANGMGKSLEDGKLSMTDIGYFLDMFMGIPAAIENISEVPEEIKDLSEEELRELKEMVVDEFDIPQDEAEEIIETALGLGIEFFEFVQRLRDYL